MRVGLTPTLSTPRTINQSQKKKEYESHLMVAAEHPLLVQHLYLTRRQVFGPFQQPRTINTIRKNPTKPTSSRIGARS